MTTAALKDALASKLVSRVILTFNISEDVYIPDDNRVIVIRNLRKRGFASNHNQAFALCNTNYFCVMNPDVRFGKEVYESLISALTINQVAIAAPLIVGKLGNVEDSARYFPSIGRLLKKLIFGSKGKFPNSYKNIVEPDWVAGMFMMFRSSIFKEICGFDEKYFLYYEDVDICKRVRNKNLTVVLCSDVKVSHYAQRKSHKSSTYALIHLRSMFRYLILH
nr:glycosyltransferase [Rhizobium sp. CFBP 8762]